MPDQSVGNRLKKINKEKKKNKRFLKTRMWMSTIISALYNDRGVIPPNIGNNIFIGNNMYITKNDLSACILIKEYSDDTPVAFVSDLMREVKSKVQGVTIDFTFKNRRCWFDTSASGLKSRISTWEKTLDNPYAPASIARRSARLLYTVDVVRSGEKVYRTRTYITVRAKTGTVLNMGIHEVCSYLDSYAISYRVLKSGMKMHLEYMLMISDRAPRKMKDVPYAIMSNETLAEITPAIQGMNDENGTDLGLERLSNSPYNVNFRLSANAKNIFVGAQSGFGKTMLVEYWLFGMYADMYNMCIMDIKGTEFTQFTKAANGRILSQRPDSTYYVNTFRWVKEEVKDNAYRAYADRLLGLSKKMMMLICDLDGKRVSRGEALIEEFLHATYESIGVLADNPNTWTRTDNLDPYIIYDYFDRYLSNSVIEKYQDVAVEMRDRLRIFMCRDGSCAYMFRNPYSYKELLDTQVLTFDFGLLENSGDQDPVMFKIRVLFMEILNDEFVAYKKSLGQWTVKVMEEAQIVKDYVMDIYVKEMTMGRARNQINIMLGNSISLLASNPKAKAAIENINILVLGVLNSSSRKYVEEEFSLSKIDCKRLEAIVEDPDYDNTFLLINRMQKNSTTGLIKAFVPDRVRTGRLFKVVDTEDE